MKNKIKMRDLRGLMKIIIDLIDKKEITTGIRRRRGGTKR